MRWSSPAKLNLTFQIVAKRSDGYHEISSLFQAIDLCDRLTFHRSQQDRLTCSDPTLPTDSTNLVSKALALFRSRYPFDFGVEIYLEKNIPQEAGLGGGSSNAATTLWALNELTGRPASLTELVQLGAVLGSDVSFFFSLGTAHCKGRGEILESASLPTLLSGWIAKPHFGLSTPAVYKEIKIGESSLRTSYFNDLEIPAFCLEPRLALLKVELKKMGFAHVSMTGSGTAFFCLGSFPQPLEGVTFFPFRSLLREPENWYPC